MHCKLKDISFKYDDTQVLDKINMEIKHGDIVSIVGPSGAGKTTLLKILTGLLKPDSGDLIFSPEPDINNPRIIVFQDYLLFPHMDIYENIAFGLRARKIKRDDIDKKVKTFLKYFDLEDKINTMPHQLSAGQKQRVAIARSMILEPQLLLLDEPFANLDYNLKAQTAEFIRKTQKHFGVTTVSVTHDQREAFTMSDKIGIMLDGKLIEYNNTENIYKKITNVKAAEFLGNVNKIEKKHFDSFNFSVRPENQMIYVRGRDMTLEKDENSSNFVESIQFTGEFIIIRVNYSDNICIVNSFTSNIGIGDRIKVTINDYLS